MGSQDPVPFTLHPKPSSPAPRCAMSVHTPLAHRYCRSFSRRSLPRLDMMSSGTLGVGRMDTEEAGVWGGRVWTPSRGRVWKGNFLVPSGIQEGRGSPVLTWW